MSRVQLPMLTVLSKSNAELFAESSAVWYQPPTLALAITHNGWPTGTVVTSLPLVSLTRVRYWLTARSGATTRTRLTCRLLVSSASLKRLSGSTTTSTSCHSVSGESHSPMSTETSEPNPAPVLSTRRTGLPSILTATRKGSEVPWQ